MERKKLLAALKRLKVQTGSLVCMGCRHEHNCGIHGCAIIREGVEVLTKSSEWISVKDRMPSKGVNVLVYAISKYIDGERFCIDRLEDGETHAVWMYTHGWFEVTHWMPLPEPPEKGK